MEDPRGQRVLPADANGLFLGVDPVYLSGVVVVTLIMMFYVAVGGMKGTTLNQIFQFWSLWFAMFLVAAFAFGNRLQLPGRSEAKLRRHAAATKTVTR